MQGLFITNCIVIFRFPIHYTTKNLVFQNYYFVYERRKIAKIKLTIKKVIIFNINYKIYFIQSQSRHGNPKYTTVHCRERVVVLSIIKPLFSVAVLHTLLSFVYVHNKTPSRRIIDGKKEKMVTSRWAFSIAETCFQLLFLCYVVVVFIFLFICTYQFCFDIWELW